MRQHRDVPGRCGLGERCDWSLKTTEESMDRLDCMQQALTNAVDWKKGRGMVTVIAQPDDGEVILRSSMDIIDLRDSLCSSVAVYCHTPGYRVSLQGTDGVIHRVQEAFLDCDADAVLLKIQEDGERIRPGFLPQTHDLNFVVGSNFRNTLFPCE